MDRVDYQSVVIQDIVNLHNDGTLDLNPWYQRRSVWTRPQKSYLINTLFEHKPVPAIYIRHTIDLEREQSVREVVDGQQRLRTIISYVNNEFSARHPQHGFSLKTYTELSAMQKTNFLITGIPVGYLLGASDSDVIDIFGRINSVSKTLNEQEKRNANFSGEFKQYSLRYASSKVDFWRNYRIFTSSAIARMTEVQFISDVIGNFLQGLQDFKQSGLNRLYDNYDDEFPEQTDVNRALNSCFERILNIDSSAIVDTIFNRAPLFFSLLIFLERNPDISGDRLEEGLYLVDSLYSDTDNSTEEVNNFRAACGASTQRIAQRRTRDRFLQNNI